MRFVLTVIVCLCASLSIAAQNEKNEFGGNLDETKVSKLTLAREDADGNIEENLEIFTPKDIPILVYVDLSSSKTTAVKLNFIAVKVKGVRPNSRIISASYKTKKGENAVTFSGKPEKNWLVGTYRIDISLDGKPSVSKEFQIEADPKH